MPAELITEHGPTSKPVLVIGDDEEVLLGRLADNAIVMFDRHVSRQHARIRGRGGRFYLMDQSSVNGTWLNGLRVECETPLCNGQLIRAGSVLLRFAWQPRDGVREMLFDPAWRDANDRAVLQMAESIARHGFADMPILADALEDAGCTDEDILRHCRERQTHLHRCWLIDLILPPTTLPQTNHATAMLPGSGSTHQQ